MALKPGSSYLKTFADRKIELLKLNKYEYLGQTSHPDEKDKYA